MWKIALSRFRNRGPRHIPLFIEQRAQPDAKLDNEQGYDPAANGGAGVLHRQRRRIPRHQPELGSAMFGDPDTT
jgi:hypothetical protein